MDKTPGWYETVKSVIFHPKDFFKKMPVSGGFGEPFRFALVNIILSAILTTGTVALRQALFPDIELQSALSLLGIDLNIYLISIAILTVVFGSIGIFISSAIYHLFLKIVGAKKSYEATFRTFAYLTAFSLLSWISAINTLPTIIIGVIISLYVLYVMIMAFRDVHDITTARAVISVVLVIVLFIIIVVIISIIVGMFAYLWVMGMQQQIADQTNQQFLDQLSKASP